MTNFTKEELDHKQIDDNTFEFVEVYDLSHAECPIVLIGGSVEVLQAEKDDNQ